MKPPIKLTRQKNGYRFRRANGTFASKGEISSFLDSIKKIKVTITHPETKEKTNSYKYVYKGRPVSRKVLERRQKREIDKTRKESLSKTKGIKTVRGGIESLTFPFGSFRIDRINDIDFGLFAMREYARIYKQYIQKGIYHICILDIWVRVDQDGDTGEWIRTGVFLDDISDTYFTAINATMKICRDSGVYLQRSDWRYKKVKTKKHKVDELWIKGNFILDRRTR